MISSCVSLRTLILNILSTVLTLSSQVSFTVEFGDLAPARELTLHAFRPSLLTAGLQAECLIQVSGPLPL